MNEASRICLVTVCGTVMICFLCASFNRENLEIFERKDKGNDNMLKLVLKRFDLH